MNDLLSRRRDGAVRHSRREVVQAGGSLLAAGALAWPAAACAQSPAAVQRPGGELLLVQSFSHGSLFPTQGDVGVPPYTVILWDAADRGLFFVAATDGGAGFAPTDALIAALEAGERPRAALVIPAAPDGSRPEQAWALTLVYGGLGADAGAVTYQGEPIADTEAAAWLGAEPERLPDGPQALAGGYLLIAGLPGLDLPEGNRVRLALG